MRWYFVRSCLFVILAVLTSISYAAKTDDPYTLIGLRPILKRLSPVQKEAFERFLDERLLQRIREREKNDHNDFQRFRENLTQRDPHLLVPRHEVFGLLARNLLDALDGKGALKSGLWKSSLFWNFLKETLLGQDGTYVKENWTKDFLSALQEPEVYNLDLPSIKMKDLTRVTKAITNLEAAMFLFNMGGDLDSTVGRLNFADWYLEASDEEITNALRRVRSPDKLKDEIRLIQKKELEKLREILLGDHQDGTSGDCKKSLAL